MGIAVTEGKICICNSDFKKIKKIGTLQSSKNHMNLPYV